MADSAAKTATKLAAIDVPAREIQPLKRGGKRWEMSEIANNSWRAFAHESLSLKDLENEATWTLVAGDLKAYDRVTVIREDRAFWADCLVIDAKKNRARVVVLNALEPVPPSLPSGIGRMPDGYDIRHDDATGRWIAFRVDGNITMNGDGSNSEEEALRALLDHAVFRT